MPDAFPTISDSAAHEAGVFPDAANRLRREREELFQSCLSSGTIAWDFSPCLTRLTDDYFYNRLSEICSASASPQVPAFAVLAVGGYGRGELCPRSDLDVLVLFVESVPEQATALCRDMFLPLWDLGLDLGHGVRSVEECLNLALEDQQVFTSLLSARLLGGSPEIMHVFGRKFVALAKDGINLFQKKLIPNNDAMSNRNNMVENLLEPNLKVSPGGLRDYHQMLWLAPPALDAREERIYTRPSRPFSNNDLHCLEQDVTFLLQTRSALHLVAGRKTDALYLDIQPEIARLVGFREMRAGLAVEMFLARLHTTMARIRSMHAASWRMVRGLATKIPLPDELSQDIMVGADGLDLREEQQEIDGRRILLLFRSMAQYDLPLSWQGRQKIQARLGIVHPELGDRLETFQELGAIFMYPGGAEAGRTMLETGFLAALIPEFGAVQDRIQFDAYHLRPVGAHTMETIGRFSLWSRQSTSLMSEVLIRGGNPLSLLLAALFHDVGKGAEDHAAHGADLTSTILRRFHVPKRVVDEAVFLVRNHLLLFKTATRRDLHDEGVVAECAGRIGGMARLDALFLLSVADAQATGPKAWNEWTASLLHELYFKIRKLFAYGPLSEPQALQRIRQVREEVGRLAHVSTTPDDLAALLDSMPLRYLLTTSARDIARHIQLAEEMANAVAEEKIRIPGGRAGRGVVAVEAQSLPAMGCYVLTFAAQDQPGLFPTLCGALTLHELNVLAAEIFTWSNGLVLTVFHIQDPPDLLHLEELSFRLKRAVKYAMTGKLFLDYRLEEKRRSQLTRPKLPASLPPIVRFDNQSSDFYTLIEVVADDHPGCLYQIADIFERMQIHIHRAKIATQIDRIADCFDVKDHLGQKIEEKEQLREIEQALLYTLG